jgi:hypothetical protein
LLDVFPHVPIAAARVKAVAETSIVVVMVAVVALAGQLYDTASATHVFTARWTLVPTAVLSVVTSLDSSLNDAVSAHGGLANIGAIVVVVAVAIVAFFFRVELAVATALDAAVEPALAARFVALVALLPRLHDSIAAPRDFAAAGAAVGVVGVPIVAGLIRPHHAVATIFEHAPRAAAIAVQIVAVVTLFPADPEHAVATLRHATCQAPVAVDVVSVVALFGVAEDAP